VALAALIPALWLAAKSGGEAASVEPRLPALEAPRPDAGPWVERGVAEFEANRLSEALVDFTRALEIERDAGVLLHRADVHRQAGDLPAALVDVERSLKLAPQAGGWCARGNLRWQAGDADAALSDFERAIADDPTYADTWLRRALLLASRGEELRASRDLRRFLELAPQHTFAVDARRMLRGLTD